MIKAISVALIVVGFGGLLAQSSFGVIEASGGEAHLLVIDDAITPLEAKRFSKVLQQAEAARARLLIVQLSTPGGLLESTRRIVEDIFSSQVPVVVYVSPAGARAGSAGTFITSAAHIAAMAPATNIGAASPVRGDGEDLPEMIKAKATQDAAAFLRSIASERGRNTDALQDTVLDAESYSAEEAISLGVVDLGADGLMDLLSKIDGRSVEIDGRQLVLDTDGLTLKTIERTPVERFLGFIASPNIAFLLLTVGGIGIIIELFSPGLFGPGAVGVIALALAFLAFGNLPVNWVGVGLIILAMALFYLEAQVPGVGIFGISGAASFLLGAFLLFGNISFTPQIPELPDAPNFSISLWLIGAMSIMLFASMLLTLRALRQARNTPAYYDIASSNTDNLIGRVGTATTDLNPSGSVRVAGEQWSAISDSGQLVSAGERVMIVEVRGLILRVVKESDYAEQPE